MGFNADQFESAKFAAREGEVKLPALASFFADDEEPVFKVKGLCGEEWARVNEAAERNKATAAIIEGLVGSAKEKAQAVKQALGLGANVPDDLARRLEVVQIGLLEPALDMPMVVKLASVFPVEFYQLSNKVLQLTGMGYDLAKKKE